MSVLVSMKIKANMARNTKMVAYLGRYVPKFRLLKVLTFMMEDQSASLTTGSGLKKQQQNDSRLHRVILLMHTACCGFMLFVHYYPRTEIKPVTSVHMQFTH